MKHCVKYCVDCPFFKESNRGDVCSAKSIMGRQFRQYMEPGDIAPWCPLKKGAITVELE